MCRLDGHSPCGGTEAISAIPAIPVYFSRYFWITIPPIEWPISNGGPGMACTVLSRSAT